MLRDCLTSIFSNAPTFGFEVIVVDNASTDGAVEMLERHFPQVVIIKKKERHGFGHNQNLGIKAAMGEYILVYNDDTLVHGDALTVLCDFLDLHPTVGLIGPKLLNSDGSLQTSCYKFPSPLRYVFENLLLTAAFPSNTIFGDYRAWAHDVARQVDFVIGAAMLVRKTVVEQVGVFDELFFMYSEETDWQMRMSDAGWQIMLCPNAVITHLGGQSTEDAKDKQFSEFQSSSVKLMIKHYGALGAVVQRLSMLLGSVLRIAIWSALSVIVPAKRPRAAIEIHKWNRLLRWWMGLGPKVGLAPEQRSH